MGGWGELVGGGRDADILRAKEQGGIYFWMYFRKSADYHDKPTLVLGSC